jgi:GDP-D-mannose dehydratase
MNLIIGNTSQLSHYFPDDYERISSRNVDFNYLRSNEWDSVYLTFGELRIYDKNVDFFSINYTYTLDLIKVLLSRSNRIVIYTTGELWNKSIGRITMDDKINYFKANNDYLPSKEKLFKKIHELRKKDERYYKVVMIHPLYFNSIYRSEYFLMGKVFSSIIHKKKIEIGNTHFHRDIVHTKHVVEKSMTATTDLMVGAGRLYYVNDFIRDLYDFYSLDYDEYVTENFEIKKVNGFEKLYYSYQPEPYDYSRLLEDTIKDIDNGFKIL